MAQHPTKDSTTSSHHVADDAEPEYIDYDFHDRPADDYEYDSRAPYGKFFR